MNEGSCGSGESAPSRPVITSDSKQTRVDRKMTRKPGESLDKYRKRMNKKHKRKARIYSRK